MAAENATRVHFPPCHPPFERHSARPFSRRSSAGKFLKLILQLSKTPIWPTRTISAKECASATTATPQSCSKCSTAHRSEEHTSELQSQSNLVCRLLLEKKK